MINKLCYYISKVCEKTTSDVLDLIYYINERTPLHKKTVTFETSDEEYPSMVCRIIGYGEHTVDIVFGAFTCSEPTTAINEWARRKRYYDWPSKTVVDHIVNMPSYVVPKGFKGSESRGLEFRISYTLSELQLIKALNEMQLKVYILLKLLFQSEVEEQFPDIITSYCLKNVVFWLCEKAPENQFVAESLLEWLTKGLIYILDCIKEEYLPMYLMPKRNLLEGKLDKDNKLRFKKLLTDLIKEGPKVIERVRKIKSVVETLRSNVVVAMAMGYMLHRGEMFLVNNRDETLKDIGPRVIPAWMEMFFTVLQQAQDCLTRNPGMQNVLSDLLSRATQAVHSSSSLQELTSGTASSDDIIQLLASFVEFSRALLAGHSSSSLQVETGKDTSNDEHKQGSVEQDGDSDKQKQDSDEHQHEPDQQQRTKDECNATFMKIPSHNEPLANIGFTNEEKQYPDKHKHDPDERKRIIEECKKDLVNDPSKKENYTKMGMMYTELGKNWEAAECYQEALERDPRNQEFIYELNEVEKLLQEEAAYSGFEFGPAEGQRDFSSLLRSPSVKEKEMELIEDTHFMRMMAKIMSGEKVQDDKERSYSIGTSILSWEENMQQLQNIGEDLAKRMEQEKPELVAELRAHISKNFFSCQ